MPETDTQQFKFSAQSASPEEALLHGVDTAAQEAVALLNGAEGHGIGEGILGVLPQVRLRDRYIITFEFRRYRQFLSPYRDRFF